MPKSRARTRRTRKPHDTLRARARSDPRSRPKGVDLRRWQAVRAEARGDASTALRLLRDCGAEDDLQHIEDLATMVRLGDHAPPRVFARWVVRQAYRWMRLRDDERYRRALYLSLQGTYWSRTDLTVADLPPDVARVLADDWVTRELALYGYQALGDFVTTMADRQLLDAAGGGLRDWVQTPLRPYRLVEADDDVLVVFDLVSGVAHEVLDMGTGRFYEERSSVLGRLVPVEHDQLIFETLPLLVDKRTAIDIASAGPGHELNPLPWAPLLTRAIDQGRMDRMPGAGLRTTVISDEPVGPRPDLDWQPPPDARLAELVAAGLDDELAGWVQILEEMVPRLPFEPPAISAVFDALERVLPSESAMAVVRDHLTGEAIADGWDALAEDLTGDLSQLCTELAATARQRAS